MKQNIETFLEEYTKIETLLKKSDKCPDTVLEFENTLEPDDAEKLRLCRQIRNYCRHHEDYKKFIVVADNMTAFVKNIQYKIEKDFEQVKSKTKRQPALSPNDTVQDAMVMLDKSKTGVVPVIDNKDGTVIGILTIRAILEILVNEVRKTSKIKNIIGSTAWNAVQDYTVLTTTDPLPDEKNLDGIILVVDPKGKYRGIMEV